MKRPNALSLTLFGFSFGLFVSAHAASLGSSVFPDVPSGTYYDSAVGEMYADGIITGYENGKFGPNDNVTRGQVAVMMQRFKNQLSGQVITQSSSSSMQSSVSSSSSSVAESTDAGSFRFTTGSYTIDEGEGTATINIIRYGGNKGAVSFEYETENGTADSGSDYDPASGRITIADGKTTGVFTVPILDDQEAENNETIILRIKSPTGGAVIGSPDTATLTIIDNDDGDGSSANVANPKGVFEFSASKYDVAENGGSITVTVDRVGTNGSTTIQYATSNGSADSNYYDSNSGTLDFADGVSSKSFTITIIDNNDTNGNKTVNLKLSNPTGGATLGSLSTATLTIVDNEVTAFGSGSIRLDDDSYTVYEGDSVPVIINRLKGTKGEVTVKYTTQNSLAKAGQDYTEKIGTLTFKAGEAQKIITIPTLTDSLNDPNETFWFKISDVTGGAVLDGTIQATITIQ